jgi:hypothetical protein
MSMRDNYSPVMNVNTQNSKGDGSNIMNIDTIRGCPFSCTGCYAKKNSARTIKHFEVPVLVDGFSGRVHNDKLYRIGNYGDPCIDWTHSELLVKKYNILNNFIVTKLIKLDGFTGFFDRLQVSVDTINKAHFKITMQNIWKLKRDFPHVKIVMRIRSLISHDQELMTRQREAVVFANQYDIPVLDTRVRFSKKDDLQKYNLVEEAYEWRQSYLRPKHGKIFLEKVSKYYDCDLFGNHCKNCKNCEITWNDTQYKRDGDFVADLMNRNRSRYLKRKSVADGSSRLPPTYKELKEALLPDQKVSKTETGFAKKASSAGAAAA